MYGTWRFIDTGEHDAAYNMALDEAITQSVREGRSAITLRLYGWNSSAVSLGYFQKSTDIDFDYCTGHHIPVVRRVTGGRAILHGDEVTYSFAALTTSGIFSKGLLKSYRTLNKAFSSAFSRCGIVPESTFFRKEELLSNQHVRYKNPLCFASTSYGEMTVNGNKVIGSAQKRWKDVLLQQGCIPIRVNKDHLRKVFRIGTRLPLNYTFDGLGTLAPGIDVDTLKKAVRSAFEETFDIHFCSAMPTDEEIALTKKLEAEKYILPGWTFSR